MATQRRVTKGQATAITVSAPDDGSSPRSTSMPKTTLSWVCADSRSTTIRSAGTPWATNSAANTSASERPSSNSTPPVHTTHGAAPWWYNSAAVIGTCMSLLPRQMIAVAGGAPADGTWSGARNSMSTA